MVEQLKLRFPKTNKIWKVSNPNVVNRKMKKYLGENYILQRSPIKNKKYRIYEIKTKTHVDFGHINYEDYTFHKDKNRREKYLLRSTNIKGNWKKNKISPNNLSINLLW
jgi:hypothetical protein